MVVDEIKKQTTDEKTWSETLVEVLEKRGYVKGGSMSDKQKAVTTFREQIKEIVEKYGESQDTRDVSNQLWGYEQGYANAIADVEKNVDEKIKGLKEMKKKTNPKRIKNQFFEANREGGIIVLNRLKQEIALIGEGK